MSCSLLFFSFFFLTRILSVMIKEIDQSEGAFPTVIDCLTGCSVRQSTFKKKKGRDLLKPHSVPGQNAPWVPITSPNLGPLINPILLLGKLNLSKDVTGSRLLSLNQVIISPELSALSVLPLKEDGSDGRGTLSTVSFWHQSDMQPGERESLGC